MEGTATWSTLRQRRRRTAPKFAGRPRHNLARRQSPALLANEEEAEEADGEQEEDEGDEEEEAKPTKPANQQKEQEEESKELIGAREAESDSEAGGQGGAAASSASDSDAQQSDSDSDSEREKPPPAVTPPPPGATPTPPPGVQSPPAAPSLPPPAAQGSPAPQAPSAVLNRALTDNIPPARGFITLVPGAPPPSNPPPPPPAATPSNPPVSQPQSPPPASQSSAPPSPTPPPAAETHPSTNLPPPQVGNAASGTPRPVLLPPSSQFQASNTPSASAAPADGTDRGFAIGVSFAIVAIIGLLIGAVIFGVKRYKRKKKVAAVESNMTQNSPLGAAPAGNSFLAQRESAILRQPKRSTGDMERAVVTTFSQTQIANRTTKEMEEQMVEQFKTDRASRVDRSSVKPLPNPPTTTNPSAAVPPLPSLPSNSYATASVEDTRNLQAESFYYEKSINEPAVPAPLRISTAPRRPPTTATATATASTIRVPYPVSTYDMYQELGQGPYRESISIGYQPNNAGYRPYNPDNFYRPQPGQLPRAERGPDGRFSPEMGYSG
ncbi:hypothetical protein CORC01_00497 [Colletotrichum orchidophilum]|uniref:Uncharacterized protein n=1 Tax=Colletotrichum orchidophilum TaxID=1209926 RepID=A0A1G4BRX9_9PEZI|nr:uncharacterized protein CORC01_00497 [Colletotrichum orchidophilum]OHF04158.1 hypothetical protein CORC01_00497 [Colletotrichum orchidophilum]